MFWPFVFIALIIILISVIPTSYLSSSRLLSSFFSTLISLTSIIIIRIHKKRTYGYYEGKSISKGNFKKNTYFKYTETKLISLFNVLPLNFNALIPAFHKFSDSIRKKVFRLRL
jgi:hypothetical protein